MPLKAQGEFALVHQLLENSLETAGQPVKRGTMAHDHDVYVALADAAAQREDLPAIRQFAPLAEQLSERDGHRLYQAITRRAIGVAARLEGDFEAAGTALTSALAQFEGLDTRWQQGRTLLELGKLGASRRDMRQVQEYTGKALEVFESIQAAAEVEGVQRYLKTLPEALKLPG